MRNIRQGFVMAVLATVAAGCADSNQGAYEEHGTYKPVAGTPVHRGEARNWCASARLDGYGKPYMTMGMGLGGNCPSKQPEELKVSAPQ